MISTPPMKPVIKAKWIAALRSGKYAQGRAFLKTPDNKFCCLGVLCDLYAKEHEDCSFTAEVTGDEMGRSGVLFFDGKHHSSKMLSQGVMEWAGLGFYSGIGFLAEKNDQGTPFHVIATIIESSY